MVGGGGGRGGFDRDEDHHLRFMYLNDRVYSCKGPFPCLLWSVFNIETHFHPTSTLFETMLIFLALAVKMKSGALS